MKVILLELLGFSHLNSHTKTWSLYIFKLVVTHYSNWCALHPRRIFFKPAASLFVQPVAKWNLFFIIISCNWNKYTKSMNHCFSNWMVHSMWTLVLCVFLLLLCLYNSWNSSYYVSLLKISVAFQVFSFNHETLNVSFTY